MKNTVIFIFLIIGSALQAQSGVVQTRSVQAKDLTRSYLLYVPAAYTGDEAWPLVLNYHGHQSNATNQMEIHSKMNAIADTAHFLVAYPQGLNVEIPGFGSAPGWNLPGLQAQQNDLDFTDSLLHDIEKDFNVDPARIHATGWSNGSIFAFWLAFKRSDIFASVGGVSGPFTLAMLDSFAAIRPVSTLFMHGTNDPVVNFNGIPNLTVPAPETPGFWAAHNNCDPDSVVTELPDLNTNDGSTVTLIEYTNCDENTEVLFYRVNGGGHGWPGDSPSFPQIGDTNYDIKASSEIWNFFKRNSHPAITSVSHREIQPETIGLHQNYPNPFNPSTIINYEVPGSEHIELKIYNTLGQEIRTLVNSVEQIGTHQATWDGRDNHGNAVSSGVYFYQLQAGTAVQTRKMVLMR